MQYQIEQWQSCRWSKGTRYYSIELCQDIFGDWVIRRSWGRNNTVGAGKLLTITCYSREEALEVYEKQQARRTKRGYVQH